MMQPATLRLEQKTTYAMEHVVLSGQQLDLAHLPMREHAGPVIVIPMSLILNTVKLLTQPKLAAHAVQRITVTMKN